MKLRELLLFESSSEEIEIRRIAFEGLKIIRKKLSRMQLRDLRQGGRIKFVFDFDDLSPNVTQQMEPYLKNIVFAFIGRPASFDSEGGKIEITSNRPAPYAGRYNANVRVINVMDNIDYSNEKGFTLSDPNEVVDTLIHELRHALDDAISQGKALLPDKDEEIRQQYEINARFSEVLKDVDRRLLNSIRDNDIISFDQYYKHFEYEATRKSLMLIFRDAAPEYMSQIEDLINVGFVGAQGTPFNVVRDELVSGRYMGNFNDKTFRRLVTRLYKHYEYMIDKFA